jgi:hypothetical protein
MFLNGLVWFISAYVTGLQIKILHQMARLPVDLADTISLVSSDSDIIGQGIHPSALV